MSPSPSPPSLGLRQWFAPFTSSLPGTPPPTHSEYADGAPPALAPTPDDDEPPANPLLAAAAAAAVSTVAALPHKSRVDPSVIQRTDPEITVRTAWQYLPFLATQATNIASSLVSHHWYGPPRKSWGVEMTLFTAIVREAAQYSHLSSIHKLRRMLDLGQILPTPKDGIITPVTFKIKKRNLRGFIKEADACEDGKRELTAEWVVSKRMWKRMQSDHAKRASQQQQQPQQGRHSSRSPNTSTDRKPRRSESRSSSATSDRSWTARDKVILYLHGGAYFVMSAATHRPLTISIAKYTDCRLFAVNYRLAPETKFPGPVHDAVSAYFRLIYDLKIPPAHIVCAGDSAGGGLTLAMLMYLRDEGYPLPCGVMLLSPWVDLTLSCDSWETNSPYDYLPLPKQDDPLNPVKCYLGEEGLKKYMTHPYASPLFGDLHGLPPMLIQAGDAEALRDEVTLLAHKASSHGVKVTHELYEDGVHVFQAFLFLEASRKALQSMRYFVRHALPKNARATAALASSHSATTSQRQSNSQRDGNTSVASRNGTTSLLENASCQGKPLLQREEERLLQEEESAKTVVDAEIASDAHIVEEGSRPRKESLPSTPIATKLDLPTLLDHDQDQDASTDTISSEDEIDEEDDEDEVGSLPDRVLSGATTPLATPVSSSSTPTPRPDTTFVPSSASAALANSQGNVQLSLKPRIPSSMEFAKLQSLVMSKSPNPTPAPTPTTTVSTTPKPFTELSPRGLPHLTLTSEKHVRRHRRSHTSSALDFSSTSSPSTREHEVLGSAPLIKCRTPSHPDMKELLEKYHMTPGTLRTTVWRQGRLTPTTSLTSPTSSKSNFTQSQSNQVNGDSRVVLSDGVVKSADYFMDHEATCKPTTVDQVLDCQSRTQDHDDSSRDSSEFDSESESVEEGPKYAFESPGYGFT